MRSKEESEYRENEQIVKMIERYRKWFDIEEMQIALREGDEIRLMSGGGSLGIIPYEYYTGEGEHVESDVVITTEYSLARPFVLVDEWYEIVMKTAEVMKPNCHLEFLFLGRIYRIPIYCKNKERVQEEIGKEGIHFG